MLKSVGWSTSKRQRTRVPASSRPQTSCGSFGPTLKVSSCVPDGPHAILARPAPAEAATSHRPRAKARRYGVVKRYLCMRERGTKRRRGRNLTCRSPRAGDTMPEPAPRAEDVEDAGHPLRLRCRCLFIAAPHELRLDEREVGAP